MPRAGSENPFIVNIWMKMEDETIVPQTLNSNPFYSVPHLLIAKWKPSLLMAFAEKTLPTSELANICFPPVITALPNVVICSSSPFNKSNWHRLTKSFDSMS